MNVIKKLGYVLVVMILLVSTHRTWALIPLEGLVLGQSSEDLQFDPLEAVFRATQDRGATGSKDALKLYLAYYQEGMNLKNSCEFVGTNTYEGVWKEVLAKRSVVATLQYVGLDITAKALASYARTLQMDEADYIKLADNLVTTSCSPNLSVYSHKLLRQNLKQLWGNERFQLPSFGESPYVANPVKDLVESMKAKEREFHYTVKLFRNLCAWGGDVNNYRMLPPLLANPFIMATIFRQLEAKKIEVNQTTGELALIDDKNSVQVLCQDLVCRKIATADFHRRFPSAVGSTGLSQDLKRLYCGHFRFQSYYSGSEQHPLIKEWIKQQSLEDEKYEAGQLTALFTGIPELWFGAEKFKDMVDTLRANVDRRWNEWAAATSDHFNKDLLYEESIVLQVKPRRSQIDLKQNLFRLDFSVTLGELDRLFDKEDKVDAVFTLKLPKNWLRWVRVQHTVVAQEADAEKREAFMALVSQQLKEHVDKKQRYFPTQLWREGLEEVIASELLEQLKLYQGHLFDSYQEEMLSVPVRFQYGLFALNYMRYKAQLKNSKGSLDL